MPGGLATRSGKVDEWASGSEARDNQPEPGTELYNVKRMAYPWTSEAWFKGEYNSGAMPTDDNTAMRILGRYGELGFRLSGYEKTLLRHLFLHNASSDAGVT